MAVYKYVEKYEIKIDEIICLEVLCCAFFSTQHHRRVIIVQ